MDKWLVLQWNGGLGWGYPVDYMIWGLAEFGVLAHLAMLLIRWVWPGTGRRRERRTVLLACAGAVFALGFSVVLTQFWPGRERPYRTIGAFQLLPGLHSPSFPSDHGALSYTLSWIMGYRSPLWFWLTWPVSLAITFSRVAAGVHYPSDMLGSFAIAAGVGWLLLWLRPSLEPALDRLIAVLTPGASGRWRAPKPPEDSGVRSVEPWVPPEDAWPGPRNEREFTGKGESFARGE